MSVDYCVVLTQQAEENYKSICRYLEYDLNNQKARHDFEAAFDKKMQTLSKEPAIFRICEYDSLAAKGVRYALIKNYKAYYIISDSTKQVIVLHVKHCLQNDPPLS